MSESTKSYWQKQREIFVATRAQAEMLFELGVIVRSYFWFRDGTLESVDSTTTVLNSDRCTYTAEELLKMCGTKFNVRLRYKSDNEWECNSDEAIHTEETGAQACAEVLISLLTDKLVTPEECNARLAGIN